MSRISLCESRRISWFITVITPFDKGTSNFSGHTVRQVLNLENRGYPGFSGGHTDDVPIKHSHFRSNRALSFARASAVAQLLIDQGVPAQRVVAIGFAASRPRIANEDAVSRHLNRRVELVLAPMAALDDQVLQLPGA